MIHENAIVRPKDDDVDIQLQIGASSIFHVPDEALKFAAPIDMETLLRMLKYAEKESLQLQLLIECGVFLGLRIGEVTNIAKDHFYKKGGAYWLFVHKSKLSSRVIRVPNRIANKFLKLKQDRGLFFFWQKKRPNKPVIPSHTFRMADQFFKKYGFDVNYGLLRKAAIYRKIIAGVNPFKISCFFAIPLSEIDRSFMKLGCYQTVECFESIDSFCRDLDRLHGKIEEPAQGGV